MSIRILLLGLIGFVAGALTVVAATRGPELLRVAERGRPAAAAPAPPAPANEEFETIERRLRDPRARGWSLTDDMLPCFPGSRLCFLL